MMPPPISSQNTGTPTSGFNPAYVWLISLVAAMGGLLFGWDWVVIGGAKPFFESFFQLKDPSLIGWVNSCALLGCLGGAMSAGAISERFGRRPPLIAAALLFASTSLGDAFSGTLSAFVTWRVLGGVAIGLASSISPLYIAEIAPADRRGRLVSVNQLTIVVGILLAQYLNWFLVRHLPLHATDDFIRDSWFGQQAWRWMFGLTAVPSVLFLLGLFLVPESPRWLAQRGRAAEAFATLARVGGAAHGQAEMREIDRSLTAEAGQKSRLRDLLDPRLRKVLVLGLVLAVFQQWCGINVIFNYAEDIFRAAGYDISSVLSNIAWTGSVNLIATLVGLGLVDRGRRPLMLFGAGGLVVVFGLLGLCYAAGYQGLPVLLLVLAAIACYAMSLAPVTWVIISEIFPNRIRGIAVSVAVSALWVACFILTYTFPLLNARFGAAGTFWTYAGISLAGLGYLYFQLPETRGKSLEAIESELVGAR